MSVTTCAAVLAEITAIAPVQDLIATLHAHRGARLHIAPTPGAARTPLVAAFTLHGAAPLLYVVGTTDAALRAQ